MTYAASGARLIPDRIEPPTLADIAQGLGRLYRFAGQTRIAYPVLAHTFVVANLVWHATGDEKAAACALLHDAPEAFMGDIPTPWKDDGREAAERRVLRVILHSVGLDLDTYDAAYWAIKDADLKALRAEAHMLGWPAAETHYPGTGDDTEHRDARIFTAHQLADLGLGQPMRRCDSYRYPLMAAAKFGAALARYGYPKPKPTPTRPTNAHRFIDIKRESFPYAHPEPPAFGSPGTDRIRTDLALHGTVSTGGKLGFGGLPESWIQSLAPSPTQLAYREQLARHRRNSYPACSSVRVTDSANDRRRSWS